MQVIQRCGIEMLWYKKGLPSFWLGSLVFRIRKIKWKRWEQTNEHRSKRFGVLRDRIFRQFGWLLWFNETRLSSKQVPTKHKLYR